MLGLQIKHVTTKRPKHPSREAQNEKLVPARLPRFGTWTLSLFIRMQGCFLPCSVSSDGTTPGNSSFVQPHKVASVAMPQYGSLYGSRHDISYSQPNPAPSSDFDDLFSSQPGSSIGIHQDASQSSRRPRCPECGTKKMRLRAGQLICKRGHVQQHFRIEQAEDDEFLGDGVARKRRTVKVNKVRRLKSQHTPYYSQPETDIEQDDSQDEVLDQQIRRAHKRARRESSRSRYSVHSDQDDEYDSGDESADTERPQSIRADSFFEQRPWTPRSYAAASAAEESGMDSEPDQYARSSRRGIRRIWRSGVGLHGAYEGRFVLLECLQLTLRLQLHRLRELWPDKMPPETEAVARDLWTMFVSLLPVGHFPPEPLIAATFDWHTRYSLSQAGAAELFPNHATYDPESDIRHHRRRTLFNSYHHHLERKRYNTQKQRAEQSEGDQIDSDDPVTAKECIDWIVGQDEQHRQSSSQRSSEPDSLADPEDELAELDPVFAEERRQRQRSQAASEVDSEIDGPQSDMDPSGIPRQSKKRRRHVPSWATKHSVSKAQAEILRLAMVPTTISIIYLSLHLLKIPIFWADLVKLISSHKLPYLNLVHSLPLPLTRFLNKDNVHHHHLDTDVVPTITALHLHTLSLADVLHRTYSVDFGQGNVSGQLARLVEGMLLPPTFYVATKRLLDKLADGIGPGLMPRPPQKGKASTHTGAKNTEEMPATLPGAAQLQRTPKEFVLMAALLVVIKLRYGLDGRERSESFDPASADQKEANESDGVSCAPLLEPWLSALDKRRQMYMQSTEAVLEMDPSELEALYMTSEQVEAYASFAEENLILSNQIDLHEWRRLEPQRRWAGFSDFLPRSDPLSSKIDRLTQISTKGPHQTEAQRGDNWKHLESDLCSIYQHHTAPPTPSSSKLEPGTSYAMHRFLGTSRSDSDPLGLSYSPVYPRVIHHANHLVGIATPQSASVAIDAVLSQMVNPRAESADAGVKVWESAYGIQAHLEVVERMLEVEVRSRVTRMRRMFRQLDGAEEGGRGVLDIEGSRDVGDDENAATDEPEQGEETSDTSE